MRKTELLAPAGSLEVLKTAVVYGADAVYIGGEAFGLRAKAHNFSMEEMKEGVRFAHARGARVYVTANILAHNQDLEGVEQYFEELKGVDVDALIISDPGIFTIAKRVLPEVEVHISTQANNTNYGTYLASAGSKAGGCGQRAFSKGALPNTPKNTRRYGDGVLCPWFHVYFLFRQVPSEQLFYRKGRQPGKLYSPLPLEVWSSGRDKTRRVSACV